MTNAELKDDTLDTLPVNDPELLSAQVSGFLTLACQSWRNQTRFDEYVQKAMEAAEKFPSGSVFEIASRTILQRAIAWRAFKSAEEDVDNQNVTEATRASVRLGKGRLEKVGDTAAEHEQTLFPSDMSKVSLQRRCTSLQVALRETN